jgi:hypothetical protein
MLGEGRLAGRENSEKLVCWLAASWVKMIAQYSVLHYSRTPRSSAKAVAIFEHARRKRIQHHVREYQQYSDHSSTLPRPGHLKSSVSRLGKNIASRV